MTEDLAPIAHSPAVEHFTELVRRAFPAPAPSLVFNPPMRRLALATRLAFAFRTMMFAVLLCVFSAIVLWLNDPNPPVVLIDSHLDASVPAGGTLHHTSRVFRFKVCPTRLERSVVDSSGVRFEVPDVDWQAFGDLGEDTFTQIVTIDPRAAAGSAHFEAVLTYRCNPLQLIWPVVVRRHSRAFEITRGQGQCWTLMSGRSSSRSAPLE